MPFYVLNFNVGGENNMKAKRLTAALLAAAIAVSSIAPEAFAEISGAGVG